MNTENVLNLIKSEKKNKKLTNIELSKISGVKLGTLNKILCGQTINVKYDTIKKLTDALKISVSSSDVNNKVECSYNFGYVKVGAYTPNLKVADVTYNVEEIKKGILLGIERGVKLLAFPELCITGSTIGDLVFQKTLLDSSKRALLDIVNFTKGKNVIVIVGLPILYESNLYNVAVTICNGEILGFTPKTSFSISEKKYFSKPSCDKTEIEFYDKTYPFSKNVKYVSKDMESFAFSVNVGDTLLDYDKVNFNESILVNISSSNELIGKMELRRSALKTISYAYAMGAVYSNSGFGESTTDLVFSGDSLIVENGKILVEGNNFSNGLICYDLDVELLQIEKAKRQIDGVLPSLKVYFNLNVNNKTLDRKYKEMPFVPNSKELESRCDLIINMVTSALQKRIRHINPKTLIVGLSGGLDSTLALLFMANAMKNEGRDLKDIICVTMPCFGTTKRTKNNAYLLAESLGTTLKEINIKDAVNVHFRDIGQDSSLLDVTFENAQARERTQVLMDLANKYNGIVIGTGDLSELCLGWATYNGDHMSMYAVNSSIPKTLIRYLVKYFANNASKGLKETLYDVLDTPVSPELIPPKDGEIEQKTEDIVGPYLLHDFYLYYVLRYGFKPSKIMYIASKTFNKKFDNETLYKWLKNFYNRFFAQQFKRSCLPDGVKIGSVGISPRGDLVMPSDAMKGEWLKDLENIKI